MKSLTHKEFSSRGGKTTLAKYGKEHFSSAGRKGSKSKLKKYGVDYFQRLSRAGVSARKAKKERELAEAGNKNQSSS